MLKKLDKKLNAYISTFYMLTKSFHKKRIYFVSFVKKDKILVFKNSVV
jgi:hypothetical protein